MDGGHSPATAIAAGLDPVASARGVAASVVAEAVTIAFAGAAVVLGPVVGRVTQRSAVILVEVGCAAAVGCVLTDAVTGKLHRQVRRGFVAFSRVLCSGASCLCRGFVTERVLVVSRLEVTLVRLLSEPIPSPEVRKLL